MIHWRRHAHVIRQADGPLVAPTACGRIADHYTEFTSSPTESDCPECAEVRDALAEYNIGNEGHPNFNEQI